MRAAVLTAFNAPLELQDVDLDTPRPDEVVVRVGASGVCHSDLNIWQGNLPTQPTPQVLGHEIAGTVEQVGAAVRDVQVGDSVVTCPSGFCGVCSWCMNGLLHLCTDKNRTRPAGQPPRLSRGGEPVAQFVGLGGFAEKVLVHERAVARIPSAMPLDRAAVLGCAVITGMGSVLNTAKVTAGQTVAVVGCGGVGLNVVQAARLAGASTIVAVDRLPAKLDRAKLFGATHLVDASAVDAVAAVQEITGGGVDHSFEVVGRPETIEQAFGMLGIRGTTTVVGVAKPGQTVRIGALDLLQEKKLQGAQMGSSRFRLDIDLFSRLYLDGRVMLDELISRTLPLEEVNDALQSMDETPGARSVITFDS